jgi:hypothetical protein
MQFARAARVAPVGRFCRVIYVPLTIASDAALVPTFRSSCYVAALTFHELRKVIGTSKPMILVPLLYLKFLD